MGILLCKEYIQYINCISRSNRYIINVPNNKIPALLDRGVPPNYKLEKPFIVTKE